MIKRILTYYAERLEEYLSRLHRQPEGLATVGLIGSAGEECPNKVVISLVNLEKETSGDMTYMQRSGSGFVGKGAPLMMNMHVMLAAVYDGKRYGESLSVLSETLAFIRSTPKFQVDGYVYTMEIVPMSTMDLHNIWTTMGGQYYPSVICKLRGLAIDSSEIISSGSMAGETSVKQDIYGNLSSVIQHPHRARIFRWEHLPCHAVPNIPFGTGIVSSSRSVVPPNRNERMDDTV